MPQDFLPTTGCGQITVAYGIIAVNDRETELYYLSTRYYNPETGRFLNVDALTSTGQGILGNNMFTYCQNNPVIFLDPNGMCRVVGPNLVKIIDCEEIDCKMSNRYVEGDFSKELAVLRGETNMYYDTPVVRTPVTDVGFSFDVIYLGKTDNIDIHTVYWLRHEYGHIQQQKQLGRLGYTVFVVVPSAVAFWKNQTENLGVDYYDFPTEYIADQLSGVPRDNRSAAAQEYAIYYWDFVTSICGPLV